MPLPLPGQEREFFIDNLLVRIHFIIVMFRWTGLAPWEFESPFPGSLTSTFPGQPSIPTPSQHKPQPKPKPHLRTNSLDLQSLSFRLNFGARQRVSQPKQRNFVPGRHDLSLLGVAKMVQTLNLKPRTPNLRPQNLNCNRRGPVVPLPLLNPKL